MGTTKKRTRHRIHRRSQPGSSPGTLVADPNAAQSQLEAVAYQHRELRSLQAEQVLASQSMLEEQEILWLDVSGLGDLSRLRRVAKRFDMHPLALEDVINVHQRPKLESYPEHLFMVLRVPLPGEQLATEQIALLLGGRYVVSFREQAGPLWGPLKERLQNADGRLRNNGSDYLAYCMLDTITDAWFPLLERYGERLEEIEDAVLDRPHSSVLADIHVVKHELLAMRRAIWPLRELFATLTRGDLAQISAHTAVYLRDCYDHVVQLIDMIETYREIASGLVDIYLSSQSAQMNEVMKVLTIIATIFIPLGTIASIYGMNFDTDASPWNMPELGWVYGYPFALAIMLATAVGLMSWFWYRGWLGQRRARRLSD